MNKKQLIEKIKQGLYVNIVGNSPYQYAFNDGVKYAVNCVELLGDGERTVVLLPKTSMKSKDEGGVYVANFSPDPVTIRMNEDSINVHGCMLRENDLKAALKENLSLRKQLNDLSEERAIQLGKISEEINSFGNIQNGFRSGLEKALSLMTEPVDKKPAWRGDSYW